MREHRAAATTAGILYIIGTVAGVLSKLVAIAPVSGADDRLAAGVHHSGAVVTCALLVLVMGLSLALVPVALFPVLRRVDEVLAIGYLVVRGAVETTCYVLSAISLLLLVPVGEASAPGLSCWPPLWDFCPWSCCSERSHWASSDLARHPRRTERSRDHDPGWSHA